MVIKILDLVDHKTLNNPHNNHGDVVYNNGRNWIKSYTRHISGHFHKINYT
jgi:hypothetical protein